MKHYLITLFLAAALLAQIEAGNVEFVTTTGNTSGTNQRNLDAVFNQDDSKIVAEIWGTIYIKNRELRDSVQALIGKRLTRVAFDDLKTNIEENGQYKYNLKVSLYPLQGDSVRVEIDPDRKSRLYTNRSRDYYDDYDNDYSYESDGEIYSIGYDFDWMIEVLEDHSAGDLFQIGARGESEHNFVRLFAGIEYASGFGPIRIRLGSGIVKHGVFQFNYSNGEGSSQWQSSLGRLNPNLRLTPLHVIGQLTPHYAIGKLDILAEHHTLRFNYTIDQEHSSFADTLHYKEKKQKYGFRGEYTLSYLDNARYPISGVYFNGQYQSVYVKDKTTDVPYEIGNDYAMSLYNRGTYNNTMYGNAQFLIKYNYNSALRLGVQGVYQEFDMSKFNREAPVAIGSIGFSKQELQFLTATASIRKRFDDDSTLEFTYGQNHLRLLRNIDGKIQDSFLEVRIDSSAMEYKFMYIFDRKIDNPTNVLDIEKYMHHDVGMVFSVGVSLGSLY